MSAKSPGPRFPSGDEWARASTAILDAEELVDRVDGCLFRLLHDEAAAAKVSFAEIGRLGCQVEELKEPLRRMVRLLDRLDEVRIDFSHAAEYGSWADVPRYDEHGDLVPRPIDAYGSEIKWEYADA